MRSIILFASILFFARPASSEPAMVNLQKIYDHIHKTYSTPATAKLKITDLKQSPVKGLLTGSFELSEGEQKQKMPIQISADGRYYVLSEAFRTVQSSIPVLRAAAGDGEQPAPPVLVSEDGRYVFMGPIQDASIDPEKEVLSKMNLQGAPAAGPADAPIVLVEYSDLECPFCEKAHAVLSTEVLPSYEGKVRWVFKNYPLTSIHPWAYDAAIAAACVGMAQPSAYMKFITSMFREQKNISPQNLREKALTVAKESGVDAARWTACYDKKESKPRVEADIREADRLGVTGTPTLFVNGRRLRSYQAPEVRRIIDEKLGK